MRFESAIHFLHAHEGGTNTDPIDRGGNTKFGISEKQYHSIDILNMSRMDADSIYYTDYWMYNSCHKMKADFDIVLFDTSVNCGQPSAAKWLQFTLRLLGSDIKIDGVIGPITVRESLKYHEDKLIKGMTSYRLQRYTYILSKYPKQIRYIKGWVNRVSDLLLYTL